jgi:hypothetical protein
MFTMVDELFDRGYQAGRVDLNAGLDRVFHRIGAEIRTALAALNRLQWSAPWSERRPANKDAGCA